MKCLNCGTYKAVTRIPFCSSCIAQHAYALPPHTKLETEDAVVTLYGDLPSPDVIVAGGESRDSGDVVGSNAIFTAIVIAAVLSAVAFGIYLILQH